LTTFTKRTIDDEIDRRYKSRYITADEAEKGVFQAGTMRVGLRSEKRIA
jgi:hypothetical protein